MSLNELDLGAWESEQQVIAGAISTKELDALVHDMKEKEEQYRSLKDESDAAHENYEEAKNRVMKALSAIGKSKYHVDGLGTVSRVVVYKVTTPKDLESKKQMLTYFREQGAEIYLSMVTIPYQSLNAYYNREAEVHQEQGKIFSIPGVDAPIADEHIRFTKERSKK